MLQRCGWCQGGSEIMTAYHDADWGVAVHTDGLLFEMLTLEGAQAGLSWLTVLRKREEYRAVFDQFQPALVAAYTPERVQELLLNPGIIRNRAKVNATVSNARAVLEIQSEFGSLDAYLWGFVDGKTIQNRWQSIHEVPAKTDVSDRMSKALLKRGFRFVGSTICYAFMQSVGMVNDHEQGCFRYQQLGGA